MTKGTENSINTAVGKRGSIFVNDTSTHNSTDMIMAFEESKKLESGWSLVHCLEDTQFAALTDGLRSTLSNDITSTGVTIQQGVMLGGDYTKVRLRSGSVIIYV